MGQLLVPAMIGAGVGAIGGAAMGKNPFKTALLGAGVGAGGAGLFGTAGAAAAGTAGSGAGAGLIGGANLSTAGGLGIGSGATSGLGSFLSSVQGVETAPVSFGTGGYASGIGGQIIPNLAANVAPVASSASTAGSIPFGSTEFISPYTKEGIVNFADGTASTFSPDYLSSGVQYGANAPDFTPVLGKSADYTGGGAGGGGLFGSIKDMFGGLSTSDKVGLGLKGVDLLNQPQQQIQQAPVTPITRGNPDMVSTPLYNVAPNVGRQQGNEIGLPNLLSRMPLSEEEKMRLQQMAQQGYRG